MSFNQWPICPYCGSAQRFNFYRRHVQRRCPENPALRERVQRLLRDPDQPGCMVSRAVYDQLAAGEDLPKADVLARHCGGWDGVALWAGLTPPSQRESLDLRLARQELHRLSQELHGGACGPSYREYQVYGDPARLGAAALRQRFGRWRAVLTWADLPVGSSAHYRERARAQRKAAERALDQELDRAAHSRRQVDDWPLSAIVGWRVLGEWCPRRKRYIPVRAQQVYLLR